MEKLIQLRNDVNWYQDQMEKLQQTSTNGLSTKELVQIELDATKYRIKFEKAQGEYLVLLGDTARAEVEAERTYKPMFDALSDEDEAGRTPPDWDKEGSGDVVEPVADEPDFKFKSQRTDEMLPAGTPGWKGNVSAKKK